jgi:hypothetical protein
METQSVSAAAIQDAFGNPLGGGADYATDFMVT